MANPQPDKHTEISNEILEHLMAMPLSGNQWQILMYIFRKTYGFHKKHDYITNSQIIEATGLGKSVVSRALSLLENGNFLTRKGHIIGFQKDWELWKPELARRLTKVSQMDNNQKEPETDILRSKLSKWLTIENDEKLAKCQPELAKWTTKVSHSLDTQKKKETITKETIQKKEYGEFKNVLLFDDEYKKLTDRFGEARAGQLIETLSAGIRSKGYKYKDHYAAILNWARRDEKEGNGIGKTNSRGNTGDIKKGAPGNRPSGAFDGL